MFEHPIDYLLRLSMTLLEILLLKIWLLLMNFELLGPFYTAELQSEYLWWW